jgi:hypothetical protein
MHATCAITIWELENILFDKENYMRKTLNKKLDSPCWKQTRSLEQKAFDMQIKI